MTKLYNTIAVKDFRRELRKNQTHPEQILWNCLRNRQINQLKFKRQYSVGNLVIDFFCPVLKLALEVDGGSHYTQSAIKYDQHRQKYLESLGIKCIRFTNLDIMENLDGVLQKIYESTKNKPHPASP